MKKYIIPIITTLMGVSILGSTTDLNSVSYNVGPSLMRTKNNENFSTLNKIRPEIDDTKEQINFSDNVTIKDIDETFSSNGKSAGKNGTYQKHEIKGRNNSKVIKSFWVDYNPIIVAQNYRINITIESLGYYLLQAHVWRTWNHHNTNSHSGIRTISFYINGKNWNNDWVEKKNINDYFRMYTWGDTDAGSQMKWAQDARGKRHNANYWLVVSNDASNDRIGIDFVIDHNYETHAGRRYNQWDDLKFRVDFDRVDKKYFALDNMKTTLFPKIQENITLQYPILPSGTTFEDIAYLVRMNWAANYSMPWKYVDLQFLDNHDNVVWDETMENEIAKDDEGPLTYFQIKFKTNRLGVNAGVIKNINDEDGIGEQIMKISLPIINGTTSWKPYVLNNVFDSELARRLNTNTNKFVNGNFETSYIDTDDNKRKVMTNNDMIFSLSESNSNPLIKEVRLNGGVIAPNTEIGQQEWLFPIVNETKNPLQEYETKVEIDWQDIYNGKPGTKIQTIELFTKKKEMVDYMDLSPGETGFHKLETYIGILELEDIGNEEVPFEFVDVINYESNTHAVLDFSKSISDGLGSENPKNIFITPDSSEANMDYLRKKGVYFEENGGVWNDPLGDNKISLPHGEWRFNMSDLYGNSRDIIFISNPLDTGSKEYLPPLEWNKAKDDDFDKEMSFDEWKFKIDETLKSYLKNDKEWLSNYRLDYLYGEQYDDLNGDEFKALMRVMILENGEIPMPKLSIKDRVNPWVIVGGIFAGLSFVTIMGGLMYRFNPRQKKLET